MVRIQHCAPDKYASTVPFTLEVDWIYTDYMHAVL